jgi:SAM-dependent methyltransferase
MTDLMPTLDRSDPAHAGQAVYTRSVLSIYDAVVYGFNSPVLWRCPKERIVAHYDANVSARHLDIGVATGALLDACSFPAAPELTLMDLNPNSLAAAAARLARYEPRTHRANVLEDWRLEPDTYDSVAMTHLLHCVPGPMSAKGATAFEHAHRALAPGGTLFGATILGRGVPISPLARAFIAISNARGILDNREDTPAALATAFPTRAVTIHGTVALFTARKQR